MKTFVSFITIILFLNGNLLIAQTPSWEWVSSPNGNANCRSITTDTSGCVFFTGCFSNNLVFDTTIILTSSVFTEMYLASYNTEGHILWAKNSVGNYGDEGQAISTGLSGNIYVTGEFFSNNITFDSITLTNNYITPYFNDAKSDIFLVKYNNNGEIMWARSGGNIQSWVYPKSSSTGPFNRISVTGTFIGGGLEFGTTSLPNYGSYDIYFVQYDSSGNVLWAETSGGEGMDWGQGTDIDNSGSGDFGGYFEGSSMLMGDTTLINPSQKGKIILAKKEAYNTFIKPWNNSNVPVYNLINYPNPFNSRTVIEFSMKKAGLVNLKVYNILGKEITTLISDDLPAVTHKYIWHTAGLASVLYFCKICYEEHFLTKKVVLFK